MHYREKTISMYHTTMAARSDGSIVREITSARICRSISDKDRAISIVVDIA